MTGYNGSSSYGATISSLGESAISIASAGTLRWAPPPWKFGLRQSDDRRDM